MHVPDHGVFNPGAQESGWQVHRALLRVTRVHREVQLPLVDVMCVTVDHQSLVETVCATSEAAAAPVGDGDNRSIEQPVVKLASPEGPSQT